MEAGSCANIGDFTFEKNVPASRTGAGIVNATTAKWLKVQTVCCSQLILCSAGQGLTVPMNYSLHNKLYNLNKGNRMIWKKRVLLLPT